MTSFRGEGEVEKDCLRGWLGFPDEGNLKASHYPWCHSSGALGGEVQRVKEVVSRRKKKEEGRESRTKERCKRQESGKRGWNEGRKWGEKTKERGGKKEKEEVIRDEEEGEDTFRLMRCGCLCYWFDIRHECWVVTHWQTDRQTDTADCEMFDIYLLAVKGITLIWHTGENTNLIRFEY